MVRGESRRLAGGANGFKMRCVRQILTRRAANTRLNLIGTTSKVTFTTSCLGVKQGIPMRTNIISLNPFSLMMEPEVVLQAMERSMTLRGLRRHQLRPLDKPLIPYSKIPGAAPVDELADDGASLDSDLDA
jgi:hypothetical protein